MVLAAVTVSDNESPLPFFPLTVEYKEKTYAAGKIPGGFIKREGRPHDHEILGCRIIDRSIRPLFPEGFQNEVQVFMLRHLRRPGERRRRPRAPRDVVRAERQPRSRSPSPIAGVRVGRVQGNWVLNPTFQQLEYSDMEIVVAGSQDSIMMVEGGALEVSEEDVVEAITVAHAGIRELIGSRKSCSKAQAAGQKIAWEKADRHRRPRRQGEGARRREDQRGAQPEGQAHARAGGRAGEEGSRRVARAPSSRTTPRRSRASSATSSTTRCARRC